MRSLVCFVFTLVCSFVLQTDRAKADRFVTCVQMQLEDADLNPGPIDGKLGRKTRSALKKFRKVYPKVAELPRLTKQNASVFCRAIGLVRESRVGWSEKGSLIKLVIDDRTISKSEGKLRSVAKEVSDYYLTELEVTVPAEIIVVTSVSIRRAARLTVAELKAQGSHSNNDDGFTKWCRGKGYCGGSYGGVAAIRYLGWGGFPEMDVRRILAHEVAHEIQVQYVGNYRGYGEENHIRARGPVWLTEALALALESSFLWPEVSAEAKLVSLTENRTYSAKLLRSLKCHSSYENKELYKYATYAGLLLVSKSSEQAVLDFWENTPALGWKNSFAKSFGMTVEEFYKSFGK